MNDIFHKIWAQPAVYGNLFQSSGTGGRRLFQRFSMDSKYLISSLNNCNDDNGNEMLSSITITRMSLSTHMGFSSR